MLSLCIDALYVVLYWPVLFRYVTVYWNINYKTRWHRGYISPWYFIDIFINHMTMYLLLWFYGYCTWQRKSNKCCFASYHPFCHFCNNEHSLQITTGTHSETRLVRIILTRNSSNEYETVISSFCTEMVLWLWYSYWIHIQMIWSKWMCFQQK